MTREEVNTLRPGDELIHTNSWGTVIKGIVIDSNLEWVYISWHSNPGSSPWRKDAQSFWNLITRAFPLTPTQLWAGWYTNDPGRG